VNNYSGEGIAQGTVTYGQPQIAKTVSEGSPDLAAAACMRAPDTCASFAFVVTPTGGSLGSPLDAKVTIAGFQNGQRILLPSTDISVVAGLDDILAGFPHDAGVREELLTLVSGTVTVTITLNNFDAVFEMDFSRANGEPVTLTNGRIASMNASWTTSQFCN
jgi:hypothetical protein